jgi:hypothetical protein
MFNKIGRLARTCGTFDGETVVLFQQSLQIAPCFGEIFFYG